MIKKEHCHKGFSLIELIIAIAILVILTGLLAPQFMKYIESSRRAKLMQELEAIDEALQLGYVEASEGTGIVPIGQRIVISFGKVTEDDSDAVLITKLIESLKENIGASVIEKTVIELYPYMDDKGNLEDTLTSVENVIIKYFPKYPSDETFYFYAKGSGKYMPTDLGDATFGKGHIEFSGKVRYDEKWK